MKKIVLLILLLSFSGVTSAQTLHLYGGKNHNVYLGCLNCDKYDSNSVWNLFGAYGNKYNSSSIWNKYGDYGDKYSDTSPWNGYASNPPVVVDKQGNFYGYFTVNAYKNNRAEFKLALYLYKFYDEIREDISKWYELIF